MMGIINSPYKALTVKKISIALIFLSLGLALYSLFTYLAYFSSGLDIFRVWEIHRFFPVPTWAKTFPEFIAERGGDVFFRTDFDRFNLMGKALWFLGIYLLVFSYFCAGIGISRLTLEEKRGDPFYPFLDALKESFKKSGLFITTTLTLLSSFFLLLFFHLLFSFTANFKPLFYPTAIILIFAFPFLFILSAMFLYMLVGFLVGIIYGPITATSFEGDTFDIFYEGFTVLNERPFKALFLEILNLIVSLAVFSAFSFLFLRAVILTSKILTFFAPSLKFLLYPNIDLGSLPQLHPYLSNFLSLILPKEFLVFVGTPIPTPLTDAYSKVLSLWYVFALILCLAVFVSLSWTGRVFVYRELVKDKDGIDIFSIKPKLLNFKEEAESKSD